MNRSVSLTAGIVLIVLGVFVFVRGADFSTRKSVLTVGDVKLTANESHVVPQWAAGLAVVAGVVLLAAGAKQRA